MKNWFVGVFSAFLVAAAAIVTPPLSANAQEPTQQAKKYLVPAGELMRVDEGVFDLKIGGTIDLTNRRMLLSIYELRNGCCRLTLNGKSIGWSLGARIDLKREGSTREFVEDKDQCFLDIVDVVTPKGGSGTMTFRLHCI